MPKLPKAGSLTCLITALLLVGTARAQDLPKVAGTRPVVVAGVVSDPHTEDRLGLGIVKFQGLIASELSSVGYNVLALSNDPTRQVSTTPLTLIGIVKEEICDEQTPQQCRIAVLWELRSRRGVVLYRTLTRAVEQAESLDRERRALITGALHSLLQRPRFPLQLTDSADATERVTEPLGFKRCARPDLPLPTELRSVAAAYVLVESGSHLAGGVIISPDGLILTDARQLEPGAPLRVRASAQQVLEAEAIAIERSADVALLRVSGHFDVTCAPLRERSLETGAAVFGVSSPLSEERATSLAGSVVEATYDRDGATVLQTDGKIAQSEGAPLFDNQGRLAAVVSGRRMAEAPNVGGLAIDTGSALAQLKIKPAAVTDPRLVQRFRESASRDVGFVRDPDDPPFALTKRYTYGTSSTAHLLHRAGLWTGVVGAVGVVYTWVSFRSSSNLSPSAHDRLVLFNDVSWGLFGLGAVGFGVSYVLPEGHEVVDVRVQSAALPRPRLALRPGSVVLSGRF